MFLEHILEIIGKQNKVNFKDPNYTIYMDINKVKIFILEFYAFVCTKKLDKI